MCTIVIVGEYLYNFRMGQFGRISLVAGEMKRVKAKCLR